MIPSRAPGTPPVASLQRRQGAWAGGALGTAAAAAAVGVGSLEHLGGPARLYAASGTQKGRFQPMAVSRPILATFPSDHD